MGRKKDTKPHINNAGVDCVNQNGVNNNHNGDCNQVNESKENNFNRKNQLSKKIAEEFKYLTNLFDLLDIENLSQGRNKAAEEDDDEDLQVPNIPEKKVFKKTPSKKVATVKTKSYPHSIEDLEKELEELKGTPMTYQKQMRKKGLQVRLTKKKRKENLKQQKAALKQGTKFAGPGKLIRPVLNSDGNVVSNKFDFADSDVKKEIKRKRSSSLSEFKDEKEAKSKNVPNHSQVFDDVKPLIKKEINNLESGSKNLIENNKTSSHQGPHFNKDNKMVFSKVFIPDNYNKPKKRKKLEKDPKKILQKIKENKQKLSEIEKGDKDKATIMKEKQKWSIALKRASGEKVKDDPELLKKSIMKEKNQKMRSQKKWKARIDRVQQEKDERQKKRKDNIQARIQENKKRKMKRAIKKGRFVQV